MPTTLAYPEAPLERGRGGRVDGELKVSGQMMYADDLALPGLLYVAVVRSPYAHARIISINTEEARKVPGVHRVLTGADVAGLRFGRAVRDVPILAVEKVRFAGEMVVAVAAESACECRRGRGAGGRAVRSLAGGVRPCGGPHTGGAGRPRCALVIRWGGAGSRGTGEPHGTCHVGLGRGR